MAFDKKELLGSRNIVVVMVDRNRLVVGIWVGVFTSVGRIRGCDLDMERPIGFLLFFWCCFFRVEVGALGYSYLILFSFFQRFRVIHQKQISSMYPSHHDAFSDSLLT